MKIVVGPSCCLRIFDSSSLYIPSRRLSQSHKPSDATKLHSLSQAPKEPPPPLANFNTLCKETVQKLDYPHFYTSMFLPKPEREGMIALRAFNIEIATIKDIASKPEIARYRMNWWVDQLENIYKDNPPPVPAALALHKTLKDFPYLKREYFVKLLFARMKDLYVVQPKTIADVDDYLENTSCSLLYLGLQILLQDNIQHDTQHAASHIGKALGIVTLLKGMPHHIKKSTIYIPQEFTIKQGISQEQLFRGEIDQNIKEVVYQFANIGKAHIDHARELIPKIPKAAIPAFLSVAFAEDYLTKLQKNDFNPFSDDLLGPAGVGPRFTAYKNYYLSKF